MWNRLDYKDVGAARADDHLTVGYPYYLILGCCKPDAWSIIRGLDAPIKMEIITPIIRALSVVRPRSDDGIDFDMQLVVELKEMDGVPSLLLSPL